MSAPSIQKVFNVLEAASGDNGACLSVRELVRITAYCESTIRRALKALSEAKVIVTLLNQGDCRNGGMTNCYQMTPPLSTDDTPSVIFPATPLSFEVIDPLPFDTPSVIVTPPLSSAGETGTTEYVHEGERAAGDKDSLLSLNTKNSLVLSEKDNQTDSLKPENTRAQDVAPVDEFEDEPATEIDRPVYEQDNGFGKAAAAYLERIGVLPNLMLDELADVVKEYGWYPVKLAIHGAADEVAKAQRGERTPIKTSTWNYAKGTLRKQKSEGDLPIEPVELVFEPDAPPEPEIEPAPVIQTVTVVPGGGEQWRELGELVKSQNVELYRRYLSQCRFGGIDAGILTVQVMTERIQNACRMELNHGGRFQDWCESIWQDLKTVEFVLEDLRYAHPQTG